MIENQERKFDDNLFENDKFVDWLKKLREDIINNKSSHDNDPQKTPPKNRKLNSTTINNFSDRMNNGVRAITTWEFKKYFESKNFKQGKLGNCYFVAALRSLMQNSNYTRLITNSVKVSNQNWKIHHFIVKMPLWEPNGESISVENDDINQKQYIIKNWKKIVRSWIAEWPLWIKVLEAAYNEYVLWKDNWQLANIEWWQGSLALLNLLWKENISMFNYRIPKPKNKQEEYTSKGGFQQINPSFENITDTEVKKFLLSFNPNSKIATVSSIPGENDTKTYTVWWNTFYHKHAYSLIWVQKNWGEIQSIKIINPHDTSKIISLSYPEFLSAFSAMTWWTLTKNFMNNSTKPSTTTVYDVKPRR